MTIKTITLLFVLGLAHVFGADACDPSKCSPIPIHYEELGCEPIKKDGECCTSSYDCKHHETRDNKKCYFKGKSLNIGESLNSSLLTKFCKGSCECSEDFDFNCARIDCPEKFGPPLEVGCIRKYSMDMCCATGTACEDEVNKLATCEFEGRTYREGQRMFPDGDTCWKCFCTKDFENKSFELNKDCIKNDCNIELDEMTSVRKGCIPMYHKDICCPYDWRCPSEKDGIIPTNKEPNDKSLKCKFGKLELNIGDALSKGENRCSKCICTTPPMVDCIAMSDC